MLSLPWCMCGCQRSTCRSEFPPTLYDLGMELRWSGVAGRCLCPLSYHITPTRHPDDDPLELLSTLSIIFHVPHVANHGFSSQSKASVFPEMVMTDFWVPVVAYTSIPQVVERHEVPLGQQYRDVAQWESGCLACTDPHFDP